MFDDPHNTTWDPEPIPGSAADYHPSNGGGNGNGRQFPRRNKIMWGANQTHTVTIESAGTIQEGQYGPQMRYNLTENAIMWLDPAASDQIERATHGDPRETTWTISKRKAPNGRITWQCVQHEQPPNEPANHAPAPQAKPKPAPRPAAAPAEITPQPSQAAIPPTDGDPWSASMFQCLCAALRVAKSAEEYSVRIGRPLALDSDSVRAIAVTLFIHATGGR
jgi:hypothetical protein